MRTLWQVLLSRRVAVVAVAALAGLLFLSVLVPDPGERLEEVRARNPLVALLAERLRPEGLTRSPLFAVLPAFIAVSLAASVVVRARAQLAQARRQGAPPPERFVARRTVFVASTPEAALAAAREALRGFGDHMGPAGPGEVRGARRHLGFAGSMVFHTGLLVTLAGITLSAMGRFDGELLLAEGFPVDLSLATLLRADPPRRANDLVGIRLTVRDVSAQFATPRGAAGAAPRLTDVSALLDVDRGGARRTALASVNQPVDLAGYQLTLHRYGFAPEVVATDPGGRTRASGSAVVRVLPPGTEDGVPLDGGGELRLRLYPDFVRARGEPASRSDEPLRPVIAFRWIDGGRERASGLVARGDEAFAGGHRVAFPELHYWADFLVSRDPGLPWFSAGALLCVLGLAVRFGGYEKDWRARVRPAPGGAELELELSARYFPASLEAAADDAARRLSAVKETCA